MTSSCLVAIIGSLNSANTLGSETLTPRQLKRRRTRKSPDARDSSDMKLDMEGVRKFTSSWLNRKSSRPDMKSRPQKSETNSRQNSLPAPVTSNGQMDVKTSLAGNIDRERSSNQYSEKRKALVADDRGHSWDHKATLTASENELRAARILSNIREHERIDPELYGNLPGEAIPSDQTHDMGGRFLFNQNSIERSKAFAIAKRMPKGSHLHLHFNSEIPAEHLFPHARKLTGTMFIRSTRALNSEEGFRTCEIVFNVFEADKQTSDIFSSEYNGDIKADGNSPWMLWSLFREQFPQIAPSSVISPYEACTDGLDLAEQWARQKMVISPTRAYHDHQTHNGAWACFNQGTRAFKGLLNYESVYRWYITAIIDSMIADGVMYAELRPMLLDKSIPSDDGKRQLGHADQMTIVCEEVRKKKKELESKSQLDKFPFGLKVIYSTPRSIPKARMQGELEDCIKLKLQFPDLICGFDLVGAEDRPNNVGFYAGQLVGFTKTCQSLGISIPFMFHAGETLLDTGGSHDPDNSNLYDSLLLNAKRIGHGYALLKHPLLVQKYKKANICLELCPISNELLHLCGNARQHPYPQLLAAGLQCTLNADNPSLFRYAIVPPTSRALDHSNDHSLVEARMLLGLFKHTETSLTNTGNASDSSSLSYEFYQVLVGDPRMNLHGWKQLAQWSIEHSCLTKEEVKRGKAIHAQEWEVFCNWIVETYGEYENMGLP